MTTTKIGNATITRERNWTPNTVRKCCIANDFYTCGTNEEYFKMLDIVRDNSPEDIETLYGVAKDIAAHSENTTVDDVMYYLDREAIYTFYSVIEE